MNLYICEFSSAAIPIDMCLIYKMKFCISKVWISLKPEFLHVLDNHEDKSYFLLEWSAYASILKLQMQWGKYKSTSKVMVYARGLLCYLLSKPLAKAPRRAYPWEGC